MVEYGICPSVFFPGWDQLTHQEDISGNRSGQRRCFIKYSAPKRFPLCFIFGQTRMIIFKISGIWTGYERQDFLSSFYLRFHLLYAS